MTQGPRQNRPDPRRPQTALPPFEGSIPHGIVRDSKRDGPPLRPMPPSSCLFYHNGRRLAMLLSGDELDLRESMGRLPGGAPVMSPQGAEEGTKMR